MTNASYHYLINHYDMQGKHDEPSLNEQLLMDIRAVFERKKATRLFSDDLIVALCADPEMNWSTHNRGKTITQKQVSNRLSEYGISSRQMRIGQDNRRGYDIADFTDTFKRYLPATPVLSVTALQASDSKGYSENLSVTSLSGVTHKKSTNTLQDKGCNVVTHRNPLPSDTSVCNAQIAANEPDKSVTDSRPVVTDKIVRGVL